MIRFGVLPLVFCAGQVFAQTTPAVAPVVDALEAPRAQVGQAYQAHVARSAVQTEAIYAEKVTGDLLPGEKFVPPKDAKAARMELPMLDGSLAIIVVFGLLLGGLALWLRYAGAGVLRSGPREIRAKPEAPVAWRMAEGAPLPEGDALLALVRGMADRRAALVLLLRASLLRAAEVSDTRFARSDTEREAFRRLPGGWERVKSLLQEAEWAHYGGREVGEATFERCYADAKSVLATPLRGRGR